MEPRRSVDMRFNAHRLFGVQHGRGYLALFILGLALLPVAAVGQDKKPNIVVIFGDDIGYWNVGAYTHGMMGRTPNIDSIAKNGMLFTDHYGQPSCTAGRAAFIMGQLPIRTGMTTVGIPGSTRGIQKEDPTLAEVLKSAGYATAHSRLDESVVKGKRFDVAEAQGVAGRRASSRDHLSDEAAGWAAVSGETTALRLVKKS